MGWFSFCWIVLIFWSRVLLESWFPTSSTRILGVPKPAGLQIVQLYAGALFCSLLCPFAPLCALLRSCVCAHFVLFCAHLRVLRPTAFRKTASGNYREKVTLLVQKLFLEPPRWGRQKGVALICFDFPFFFRFVPICGDLFRFAPISSDLFPVCFQNKSGKRPFPLTPFCKSPIFHI